MKPLEGTRILYMGMGISGPFAARYLAGLGAEVIRVQAGSRLREEAGGGLPWAPQLGFVLDFPGVSDLQAGYLGVGIELRSPQGLEVFNRLVKVSDAVLVAYAGGTADKLGVGYEALKAVKDDIILVEISAFGNTGPYRNYALWGFNVSPMTGLNSLVGYSDLPQPDGLAAGGSTLTDFLGGYSGAIAMLLALEYRDRTGKGQHVDQSLMELTAGTMSPVVLDYTANGVVAGPTGNRNSYVAPYGVYRCKGEDRWCAIAVRTEEEWKGICRALEKDSLASDPRFATLESRLENHDELDRLIEEFTSTRDPYEVMFLMQEQGVPAGVAQNNDDLIMRDLQVQARDFWIRLPTEKRGMVFTYGTPVKMSATPPKLQRGMTVLSQDSDYILKDLLGMTDEEIDKLVKEGAINERTPVDPSLANRSLNSRWTGRLGSSLPRADELKWSR